MLLVTLTVNGTPMRISDRLLTLEHPWYPWIESFSSVQLQTSTDYGGFAKLGFGSITVSPKVFEDNWPPPIQCAITIEYTASNEAAATTILSNIAHRSEYTKERVTYNIQDVEYNIDLLEERDDYNGNNVAMPLAFGTVTHMTPVQLPDVNIGDPYGEAPTYYLSGIISNAGQARRIIGLSIIPGITYATAITIITGDINGDLLNHGYSNGETVHIKGLCDALDGSYIISGVSGAYFTIDKAYENVNTPIYAHVYQTGDIQIFDDGVPIAENFYDNGDGTFSLMATPVGQVTISGTSLYTTVDEIVHHYQSVLGISSYVNTYARTPSPPVNAWISSQTTIIDFLSAVCATNTHLFYIMNDTLTLVDMKKDNGSRALSEFQFFDSPKYGNQAPIKKISSTWNTYSAEEGHSGGDNDMTTSMYIKETNHEISESIFEYGTELSITAFHDDEAKMQDCLVMIRGILEMDNITIGIPFGASLPVPGERLSWTDTFLPDDTPGYMRSRILAYDFLNDEVSISGDGVFFRQDTCGVDFPQIEAS